MKKNLYQNAVIIPAYNESRSIVKLVEEILLLKTVDVIVVDDGSSDGTSEVLGGFKDKIAVFTLPVNSGKGSAMRAGADFAYSFGYENFIFIDGDGQHNPKDIPKFINGLINSDLVINHRILNFSTSIVSHFGRYTVRKLFNGLFQTKISDHLSGFRGFRRAIYPKIRWACNDYRVEIEMLARAVVNQVSFSEISTPCGRRRYKGMGWDSGFYIFMSIFRYFFFKSKLVYHSSPNSGFYRNK